MSQSDSVVILLDFTLHTPFKLNTPSIEPCFEVIDYFRRISTSKFKQIDGDIDHYRGIMVIAKNQISNQEQTKVLHRAEIAHIKVSKPKHVNANRRIDRIKDTISSINSNILQSKSTISRCKFEIKNLNTCKNHLHSLMDFIEKYERYIVNPVVTQPCSIYHNSIMYSYYRETFGVLYSNNIRLMKLFNMYQNIIYSYGDFIPDTIMYRIL